MLNDWRMTLWHSKASNLFIDRLKMKSSDHDSAAPCRCLCMLEYRVLENPFRFEMRTGNVSDAQPNGRCAPINQGIRTLRSISTVYWVK
jgi:hypothetical protein